MSSVRSKKPQDAARAVSAATPSLRSYRYEYRCDIDSMIENEEVSIIVIFGTVTLRTLFFPKKRKFGVYNHLV